MLAAGTVLWAVHGDLSGIRIGAAVLLILGLPGILGEDCLHGSCASQVRELLDSEVPAHIRYVSMFSVDDGVIDWRACLDPAAEHVEVQATHMAMGAEPSVIAAVRELLSDITPVDVAV